MYSYLSLQNFPLYLSLSLSTLFTWFTLYFSVLVLLTTGLLCYFVQLSLKLLYTCNVVEMIRTYILLYWNVKCSFSGQVLAVKFRIFQMLKLCAMTKEIYLLWLCNNVTLCITAQQIILLHAIELFDSYTTEIFVSTIQKAGFSVRFRNRSKIRLACCRNLLVYIVSPYLY